jgi:hypothetical protein
MLSERILIAARKMAEAGIHGCLFSSCFDLELLIKPSFMWQ